MIRLRGPRTRTRTRGREDNWQILYILGEAAFPLELHTTSSSGSFQSPLSHEPKLGLALQLPPRNMHDTATAAPSASQQAVCMNHRLNNEALNPWKTNLPANVALNGVCARLYDNECAAPCAKL